MKQTLFFFLVIAFHKHAEITINAAVYLIKSDEGNPSDALAEGVYQRIYSWQEYDIRYERWLKIVHGPVCEKKELCLTLVIPKGSQPFSLMQPFNDIDKKAHTCLKQTTLIAIV